MTSFLLLNLKTGISLIETSNQSLALEGSSNTLSLENLPSGLLSAFQELDGSGKTSTQLSKIVRRFDGFQGIPTLYFYLAKLSRLGAIEYTLQADNTPIARLSVTSLTPPFEFQEVKVETYYVLSRFAFCRSDRGQTVLETPLSAARVSFFSWHGGAIVAELSQPKTVLELADRVPQLDEGTARHFLSLLLSAGAIVPTTAEVAQPADATEDLAVWEFHDLLFHTRSREGRQESTIGDPREFSRPVKPLPVVKPETFSEYIELCRPDIDQLKASDISLTQALETRRSIREHGDEPITVTQLGEFLYRVARLRSTFIREGNECSSRPYPSSAASYELELYPVINACQGIPSGLYHYCPQTHRLGKVRDRDRQVEELLVDAGRTNECRGKVPQILIVLAARYVRVARTYQGIAYAGILKDVGILYQTMYLVATSMNLAPCALGFGNSDRFSRAAGTDYYAETSVGEFMLGSR